MATFLVLLALSSGGCSDIDDSPRTPACSLADFRKTLETVGIEFVSINSAFEFHNPDGGLTTGKPVDPRELERYLPLFVREFSIYPKEFLKRSGLKRIILCTDMRYSGRECAGLAQYDPPAMYLDVSEPPEDALIQCLAIHHEFFHLVDFAGDGIVGEDDGWSSLNPPGFRYNPKLGSGGDGAVVERTGAVRGFLAAQSLDNVAEDKAVVFAELIVNGSFVVKRAERDPWLRAKVIATKRALADFCPEIDEDFWESASRTERPGPEPIIRTNDLEQNAYASPSPE